MSEAQTRKQRVPKAIRVPDEDWEEWAQVAAQVGLTRSAFIKQATAHAAGLVLAGGLPYFVKRPEATTQNTRIRFFETEGRKKDHAVSGAAGVASAKEATGHEVIASAKGAPKKTAAPRKPKV